MTYGDTKKITSVRTTLRTTTTTSTTPMKYPEVVTTRVSRAEDLERSQCYQDCQLDHNYLSNPACLLDCYPAHHCLTELLLDFAKAGGVCRGSFISQNYPGLWPRSHRQAGPHGVRD